MVCIFLGNTKGTMWTYGHGIIFDLYKSLSMNGVNHRIFVIKIRPPYRKFIAFVCLNFDEMSIVQTELSSLFHKMTDEETNVEFVRKVVLGLVGEG